MLFWFYLSSPIKVPSVISTRLCEVAKKSMGSGTPGWQTQLNSPHPGGVLGAWKEAVWGTCSHMGAGVGGPAAGEKRLLAHSRLSGQAAWDSALLGPDLGWMEPALG